MPRPLSDIHIDGDSLRRTREDRVGRREDLASRAGISLSTIAHIETGRRHPSPEVLDLICKPLRIKPEQITLDSEQVSA